MKTMFIKSIAVLFLLQLLNVSTYADKDPQKHALIIAVADYPEEGKWPDISSDNDIALIKGALLRQGFDDGSIKIIVDEQAQKDGIVTALEDLKNNVNEGDIVVIHYSGHGQQIQDDSEDELDGWDEALIPWDAQIRMTDIYKGEKHLRDDEVKLLTDDLRAKLGPDGNLLLILDACHSGTGNRGDLAKTRGTDIKFSEEGYTPPKKMDEANFDEFSKEESKELAPMITMSGAGQHELNYEYYDYEKDSSYGSLSYAVSQVLSNADENSTYRSLFDQIKIKMSTIAPRQSPQIEGDVDYLLFRGEVIKPEPYYMVTEFYDSKNVTINAGNLMGIYDSSEVAFYPVGTFKPYESSPVAEGVIVYSSAIESDVELKAEIDEDAIRNTWVYITKQNFGDLSLKVKFDINNKEMNEKLMAELVKFPRVDIVDDHADLVIEMNNEFTRGNQLQMITKDEMELYSAEVNADNAIEDIVDDVLENISYFMQVNLLKKIEMKYEDLDVTIEILPVTVKRAGRRYVVDEYLDIKDMQTRGNEIVFTDKDPFKIKIKNDGYKKAFFQLIDIRPNNEVSLLYPATDDPRPPAEFVIGPGEEKELKPIFVFKEPFGKEYIKMIATEKPIDLRFIIKTRGDDTRSNVSPFEQLLKESYKGTRAEPLSVPPGSATVYTIPLKVVDAKK